MPNHGAIAHSCDGVDLKLICENYFRNYVKTKYNEGFHKFSDIRRFSNLDVELAENYDNLIGDESRFSRVKTKNKIKLVVIRFGGYPVECTKISKTLKIIKRYKLTVHMRVKPKQI